MFRVHQRPADTGHMTRRTTQTFHGWDQPNVVVAFPAGHEHPGEHKGSLRAWAVDDATGEWWAQCAYYVDVGIQLLGWVHQDHVRPVVDLTDDDGRVAPRAQTTRDSEGGLNSPPAGSES